MKGYGAHHSDTEDSFATPGSCSARRPDRGCTAPHSERIHRELSELFLAGPFTRHDIAFTQLSGGTAKGKFAINWLAGGPILQCLVARVGEVDGVPCLLPGDFSYQDAYRNPGTNEWEKPTADLKAAFRKITSLVTTRCPAFEYKPGSTVFIAPKAREMLEANTVTISAD